MPKFPGCKIPASSNAQRAYAADPAERAAAPFELPEDLREEVSKWVYSPAWNGELPADLQAKLLEELKSKLRTAAAQSARWNPGVALLLDAGIFLSMGSLKILEEFKSKLRAAAAQSAVARTKVAAHARSGRSKTPRARTIAQGIAEETKGWDGKHHWKKAVEIHGAINARLEEAGLGTISEVAIYQRLLKRI